MRKPTAGIIGLMMAGALLLSACGGDDGLDRDQLRDGLVESLTADSELTEQQIECIADGFNALTDEELIDLTSETPSDAAGQKGIDILTSCLLE
jgi:hypothetical protein